MLEPQKKEVLSPGFAELADCESGAAGPSWSFGEESLPGVKPAQGKQISWLERVRVMMTLLQPLDQTVPEARPLHFPFSVNFPFCKSYFQLGFSHRKASRPTLKG